MSAVSYRLKKKAINASSQSTAKRLKIIIGVVSVLAFLTLSARYQIKFKIIIGCIIFICAIFAHEYFAKAQKARFAELLDKAFDNEILLWIAAATKLTFKPFGAFFLRDLSKLPLAKDANECVSKRSLVGKLVGKNGAIEAKFGDARLTRTHKRKKSLLGLDRFEWARVNDGKVYSGFIAKFDYEHAFSGELSAIAKGEFMLGAPGLKLLGADVARSEMFSVFASKSTDLGILADGEILAALEMIATVLKATAQLHIAENSLFIALENDSLFTRTDDAQNADISASILSMVDIARRLECFAVCEITANTNANDDKINTLLAGLNAN